MISLRRLKKLRDIITIKIGECCRYEDEFNRKERRVGAKHAKFNKELRTKTSDKK